MCVLFIVGVFALLFYTNFRSGDARCKGPSLFPKATHPLPFTDNNFERFRTLELKNIDLLKENKRLNDDGKNGDTSMIDASSFSQHMHETTVASLTPVYHSDLNMSTFMGNNQVA